jgi:hypothetical protein
VPTFAKSGCDKMLNRLHKYQAPWHASTSYPATSSKNVLRLLSNTGEQESTVRLVLKRDLPYMELKESTFLDDCIEDVLTHRLVFEQTCHEPVGIILIYDMDHTRIQPCAYLEHIVFSNDFGKLTYWLI